MKHHTSQNFSVWSQNEIMVYGFIFSLVSIDIKKKKLGVLSLTLVYRSWAYYVDDWIHK